MKNSVDNLSNTVDHEQGLKTRWKSRRHPTIAETAKAVTMGISRNTDPPKRPSQQMMGLEGEKSHSKGIENIFKRILTEKLPELGKETSVQMQ